MIYLIIQNGFVVNIVDYGDQTPIAEPGQDIIPSDGTKNVGDAFDIVAYRNVEARQLATDVLNSTDPFGKVLRGLIEALIDEINILRASTVGVGSLTFDPASIANGAGLTSALIPVDGVVFGDEVSVSGSISQGGLTVTGYVASAGNVVIRFENQTGGAVNLTNSTWRAVVYRTPANGFPSRTLNQAVTAISNKIAAGSVDG